MEAETLEGSLKVEQVGVVSSVGVAVEKSVGQAMEYVVETAYLWVQIG